MARPGYTLLQEPQVLHSATTVLHAFSSSRTGQASPSCIGCCATSLLLNMVPSPQVFEQEPQVLHSATTQSTETQSSVLHALSSSRIGQAFPPCNGCCATSLLLDDVPPPQVSEQLPQALHSATMQSSRMWLSRDIVSFCPSIICLCIFNSHCNFASLLSENWHLLCNYFTRHGICRDCHNQRLQIFFPDVVFFLENDAKNYVLPE